MFVMPNLRNVFCPKCNQKHTGRLDQIFLLQQYHMVNGKAIPNIQDYYFHVGDRLESHQKVGLVCEFCKNKWIHQDPMGEGATLQDNWVSMDDLYRHMMPKN